MVSSFNGHIMMCGPDQCRVVYWRGCGEDSERTVVNHLGIVWSSTCSPIKAVPNEHAR